MIALGLVVSLLASIACLFAFRRLSRSVQEIRNGIERLKRGDFGPQAIGAQSGPLADEFRQLTESLRERFTALDWKARYLESMPDPVLVLDYDNLIMDFNPAFTALLGYSKEDMVGYSIFDLMDEENGKVMSRNLLANGHGKLTSHEVSLIARGGKAVPVLISCAPVTDREGEVVAKVGVLKEFSKEVSLRKSLRELGENRRVIMDSMPDILLVLNREYEIVLANRTACETGGELAGKRCYEVFHDRESVCPGTDGQDCPVQEVFRQGKPSGAVHLYHEQGRRKYVQISAYPIKDEDGLVRNAVCIMRDITAGKTYEDEIARRNKELATLLSISRKVNNSLKGEDIFNSALESLIELTGMQGGAIFPLDELGRELACNYHRGLSDDYIKGMAKFRVGEDIPGRVAQNGEIFTSADLTEDSRARRSLFIHTGIRGCASFPIKGKEKTIGVFCLFSFGRHEFTPDEERIFMSVGEITGIAFDNIKLYEKMKLLYQQHKWRKTEEQKKLLELASVLSTKLDVREMLDTAILTVKQFFRADFACFLEMDNGGNLVVRSAPGSGLPEGALIYEKGDNSIEAAAIRTKRPVIVEDIQSQYGYAFARDIARGQYKVACAIPVYSGNRALSALSFYCSYFKRLRDEDIFFFQTMANILDVALERAQLYDKFIIGKGMSETILESIEDGIITVDTQGRVLAANRAAGALAGIDPVSALGRYFSELFGDSEEDLKFSYLLSKIMEEVLQGNHMEREAAITGRSGRKVPILLNGYPARDQKGSVAAVIFALRDISRHEEADSIKSEFLRSASHEFRTPLSAIVGMTEMILDREVSREKERVYLETIYTEGKRLSEIVSCLLDLDAIESGKEVLRLGETSLDSLISEVLAEFAPAAGRKGVDLSVSMEGDMRGFKADAEKLKQMLRNLMQNSLTYSDPGSRIEITGERVEGGLELVLRDTGWGIPEDDLKHLGQKFYRGRYAQKTKGKGLGLALVKEIVKLHRGAIGIDSHEGKGTTIKIEIPEKGTDEQDPSD